MADLNDLEKLSVDPSMTSAMATSIDPEKEQDSSELSPISSLARSPHRDSTHSVESVDSDELEPLEHARTLDHASQTEVMERSYRTTTATSIGTTGSRMPDFEVDFGPDDPDNPKNWSMLYKSMVIGFVSFSTWSVVLCSTTYTSAIPGIMEEFGISSASVTTLGVTSYLLGLAVGSLIWAPLSEIYGRRPVYVGSMLLFIILVIPCALSTSLEEIVVIRFFGAVAGGSLIANAPGTVADISDEAHRALAFSIWSIGPLNGPVTGPLIGGFAAQYLGWRWTNWLVLIFAGVSVLMLFSFKETYAPAILKRKAVLRRKETGDDRWWCRYDEKLSLVNSLKVNLSRPFVLIATEPILWFWDIYVAVIYGILYLCFVAYPIIFNGVRGWSAGFGGLAFCGMGVGSLLAAAFEPLIRRLINSHAVDPKTGRIPPEASVSIICIAAILSPMGQLIFAWTSLPESIHWIWSILAGVPFGAGNTIIFIYSSNYIAGSYGIYAASALAGNGVARSVLGGTLPLAGNALYKALSPQWAGTLLGLLEVILIPIPFVFYKWGKTIREKSPVIRQMRADQERMEKRANRYQRREAASRANDIERAGDSEVLGEGVPEKQG